MVYLLKIVIFHGELLNNQMVTFTKKNRAGQLKIGIWAIGEAILGIGHMVVCLLVLCDLLPGSAAQPFPIFGLKSFWAHEDTTKMRNPSNSYTIQ